MIKIACALALAALLALAGPAAARFTQPRTFARGDADTQIMSDGARYLAYQTNGGDGRVRDARNGSERRIGLGDLCHFGGVVAAHVLVSCIERDSGAEDYDPAYLMDVRNGETLVLPAIGSWSYLGRRWIEGGAMGSKWYTQLVDWNGTSYKTRFYDDPGVDLDTAGPREYRDPVDLVRRSARFMVTKRHVPREGNLGANSLTLRRRRAGARAVSLGEYPGVGNLTIGSGLVSWVTYKAAYTYEIGAKRLKAWRFPQMRPHYQYEGTSIAHTANAVYFKIPVEGGYEILRSRRR